MIRARPRILLLTSSLLTDRMLLHTRLVETLRASADVEVWATSARDPRHGDAWQACGARVDAFPDVRPFREFPYNYLRRLNEFTWDFRTRPPSRLSMWRHDQRKTRRASIRALRGPARVLAAAGVERPLERWVERLLLGFDRCPGAAERWERARPDLVVTTNPFWFTEPAVVAAAKRAGIRTLALVPSWDNLTTKNRMVFRYDAYLLWSEGARDELHRYYPDARERPAHVIGAPQYDVFFDARFRRDRAAFCAGLGLRPDRPIVLYALGSPNFLDETPGALAMARRVLAGDLGDAQLVIRPHPIHDRGGLDDVLRRFAPRVVVQRTADPELGLLQRSQREDDVVDWVNTFRHADVVVNLASTVTVDAALLDRPVVSLDYDPSPAARQRALIADLNRVWSHWAPVARSGGVWLARDPADTVRAVRAYLDRPSLHRDGRRWIVRHVCGEADGRAGARMGEAILAEVRA